MLPKALDELARDIEAGREALTRLKKALSFSGKGVTRAHQLELITRILDHVCKSDSKASENVFRIALGSLRSLVPVLKKKTTSVTDTIAAVEKYTVNFALSASQDAKQPISSYREAELSNSLQQIFSSRAGSKEMSSDDKKATRRKSVRQKHGKGKENEDPDANLMNATALSNRLVDQLFFPYAATTLGLHMLLPNEDSLDVVNTTVGALAIRLTRCCKSMCLSDLLELTEKAVLPWLNYMRGFDDAKSQRTFAAYLKRVSCFLFDQCREPKNDPAVILRTRLFALQLENPKLNQFATDLLQCVKNFVNGEKQEKHSQHVLNTIYSVYESALRYVANFDYSDQRWISEDVSAWLDDVALIWAKRKPRKPIPSVFVLRSSAFPTHSDKKILYECFKLQNDLFNAGAYELNAETAPQNSQELSQAVWNKVAFVLRRSSFEDFLGSEKRESFLSHCVGFNDDWILAEGDGLGCLRLMRTLEPLRQVITVAPPKAGLSPGGELVLRTYLSALFRGFSVLSWPAVNKNSTEASAIGDILLRLNKLVGGAIEASRELIRSYAYQHQFVSLENVVALVAKTLQYHQSYSPSASLNWTEWLYNVMTSVSKEIFLELSENQAEVDVLQFSEVMVLCADELFSHSNNPGSFSQGYWTLHKTLRDGFLSCRMWREATDVSLRLFALVTSSETEGRVHFAISQAGRMVAQDIVRLSRNGYALAFFEELDIPADKLLSAFVEYSLWARKHCDAFKTFSKYLETIDGLVLLRRAVFESCEMSGVLCPVRKIHREWLSFIYSLGRQKEEKTEKIWKAVKSKTCSGHYPLGLIDSSAREVSCTAFHSQFLENLRKACEATVKGSCGSVSVFLSTLESILTANKQLLRHLELIMISVEALQWMSTVLAFNSFAVSAERALSLARQCTSLFNISSACETLKVCKLLDSLPELSCNLSEGKGDEIPKTSRKDGVRRTANPSCGLQKAKADLKHSLRKLWKFRLGSIEGNAQPYSVAGLSVDVSFNVSSMSGQHRLGLVLELLHYLFFLGSVQVDIESLSEARYYMELCFQISIACFPIRNNSLRRIASICRAKCMTRKDSRIAVQDAVMEQSPIEEEDIQDGRNVHSNFSTLQTVADAMLYIEMAWKVGSAVSADTNDTHANFITAMYERCQRVLEGGEEFTMPYSDMDTQRLHLMLNHGLAYLLKGDETTAVKLIKPLSDGSESEKGDIMAAASYQMARLSICRAGGLRTCLAESVGQLNCHADLPSRRVSRRRPRRTNYGKSQAAADESRTALSRAMRSLVPCPGNFPLCRKTWKLAAMMENDAEVISRRLEKTVGLSFSARYRYNMNCKLVNRAESVNSAGNSSNIDDLEKRLQSLSIDNAEEPENQCDSKDIMWMMKDAKSILVGLHMDEDKSSFIVWRRCALGFQLKRLWLPSSGSQSYNGMLQRIQSILSEMKLSSIRDGQDMTKREKMLWWEDRYRLDEEMKLLLTEIQRVWLGSTISLLIPSLFASSDEAVQSACRDFESYAELGERACDSSDNGVILGHVVLLVDTPSEIVPWESLPLLRDNEISVTRTPSISFLASMWKPHRELDPRNIFFVVNPEGNLERTEDRFRELLRCHAEWSGVTGRASTEAVVAAYSGEEIYLYCGHGAGEDFFSPSKLCVHTMAPIALLMGCSSCRPRDVEIGDFESNGPAIEFLVHGSPAVVGNLWDVSDGEIDRLTSSILSLWLGENNDVDVETMSLADAVAQSRSKCRLPYLVGAACIVMGVPDIHVQRRESS